MNQKTNFESFCENVDYNLKELNEDYPPHERHRMLSQICWSAKDLLWISKYMHEALIMIRDTNHNTFDVVAREALRHVEEKLREWDARTR